MIKYSKTDSSTVYLKTFLPVSLTVQYQLPMENTTLKAAVNSQSSSGQLITSQAATANAIIFNEEVGLGAISKTGA